MRTYTYDVERHDGIQVRIRAGSSNHAAMKAAEFALKHHLMLIGPKELAHERVYL